MAKVDAAKLKSIANVMATNEKSGYLYNIRNRDAETILQAALELEDLRNKVGRMKITIKKKDHVIRTIDHHNNRLNNDNVAKKSALESFHDKHSKLNVFLQERVSFGWGEHVVDVAMKHIENVEEENKQLREALEEIENSSAGDFDSIRQIARKALEGDKQ